MSQAQAENVIRNIIHELVQRCAARGHDVSETLAAFMIKGVVLDPRNGFDVDRTLTHQDVQKLTELCLQKLTEQGSPFLDTVKMQVYFDLNYTTRREFVAEVHQAVELKLSAVSREITDSRARSREEVHALYQNILHYTSLRAGLDSDTHTVRHTAAALQSVFPQTELGSFMALLKKDKEQQLKDLSALVTGVCLFNRASEAPDQDQGQDQDQGELHVQDLLPEVLKEVLPVSVASLELELGDCERLVWRYTSVLELLTEPGTGAEAAAERGVSVDLLRQALYNVRQHQAFLHMLQSDVRTSVQRVEVLQDELKAQLQQLKVTVQAKTAVPSAQVFPVFRSLSRLWNALQDEAELLHIFRNLMLGLRPFTASQAQIFSERSVDGLLLGSEVKTDADRKSQSAGQRVDPSELSDPDTSWLAPEHTSAKEALSAQYSGFCGHALVHRDGLLLPGNPQLGFLKYKEKLYAFSSREAALQFASAPGQFISEVAERAKRNPELIQLLRLHRQFSCVTPYTELQSGEHFLVRPLARNDGATQTDTHPVESYIERGYEWNEWALRRKALHLADLRGKQTHSTQTHVSFLRRENCTQTYPLKDSAGQTKRDGESSVPQPLVYLYGLRGQREGPVVKVELTRAVDE